MTSAPTAHKSEISDREIRAVDDPNRSTGPRTPEGKSISAQNATKHGCRSKTLILRHEDPAEYEALHKGWWDHYQPSCHAEETLAKQLIDNHWYLLRATKRVEQVDAEMPDNPCDWTDAHHKLLTTFTRYKTTAERSYQKAFRTVETYFRDCARAESAAQRADLMRMKVEAQTARKSSQPTAEPLPPRTFTPLAEIKAKWNAEAGDFLGPIVASSPTVVSTSQPPKTSRTGRA